MAGSHPPTAPPEFGATLYFVGFLHVPILRDCPGRRLSPVDCRPAPADKQTAPSPIPPNAEFPQIPNSPAACPGGTRRAAPCTRCGASSRPRPAASAGPSSGCCTSASSGQSCRAAGAPPPPPPPCPARLGCQRGPRVETASLQSFAMLSAEKGQLRYTQVAPTPRLEGPKRLSSTSAGHPLVH